MNATQSRRRKNAWATLGALAAVAFAALLAWRWTEGMDGAVTVTEVAMDSETPVTTFVPNAPPVLVDVLDVPQRSQRTARTVEPDNAPGNQTANASSKTKKERSKERPSRTNAKAQKAGSGSINFECRVTPNIDSHLVEDLDYGKPITLSLVPVDGSAGLGASTTKLIDDRPTLNFALTGSTAVLTNLVADHPDAMRTTVTVDDWSASGSELFAAPSVKLRPIGLRVQLGSGRRGLPGSRSFEGVANLVILSDDGYIRHLDSAGVVPKMREIKSLRYGDSSGEVYVLGIPKSAAAGADLLEITAEVAGAALDGSRLQIPTSLRGRTPAPIRFEVIDPYGEPLKGATVTARVDDKYVGRFTREGYPVQFGGFVFVKNSGTAVGQVVRKGQAYALNLGLARAWAEEVTGANGQAILHGLDRRVSHFTVKSPFGDQAPVEFPVEDTEAFQVTCAPLGGVEVHCPAAWRQDETGQAAWARAKVKIKGKSKMLPFTKNDAQARNPRRFLVPANRTVEITCAAKGYPKMSGELRGPTQRQIITFFPKASE